MNDLREAVVLWLEALAVLLPAVVAAGIAWKAGRQAERRLWHEVYPDLVDPEEVRRERQTDR